MRSKQTGSSFKVKRAAKCQLGSSLMNSNYGALRGVPARMGCAGDFL